MGVPVTNYFARNTKKSHYLVKEELGILWGTKFSLPNKTRSQANVFIRVINKIALKLEYNGKEVIKSMLQDWNCPEGTGKGYSNPWVA